MIGVELQVIGSQLVAITEEMGAVLVRAAFSPNIKERRDCSTALFDEAGRMVAQAEHIPVHLGAMPEAVAAVRAREPRLGEVWILNDPYAGGRQVARRQAADDEVGRRACHRQRAVEVPLVLWHGPGEVDHDLGARDGHRSADHEVALG